MITYIIRLEENEHSCRMAQECFEQAKIHGLKPKYFKAINGKDWKKHYYATGIQPKRKFKKGKLGVRGCFFSHYYLWLECLKQGEPMCILEHDGYILRPFGNTICDQFEDVLKLDRLDPYSKKYNQLLDEEKDKELQIEKYVNQSPKNPYKIGTGNYFKGAYAYILKPEGAHKLIKHIRQHGHVTADQQIGDWVLNTNTTVPSLARLHPFYSIGDNIKTHSLTQGLEGTIDDAKLVRK
jgi:GR25 family glycosyltransferase involved in LPS biosynthesis